MLTDPARPCQRARRRPPARWRVLATGRLLAAWWFAASGLAARGAEPTPAAPAPPPVWAKELRALQNRPPGTPGAPTPTLAASYRALAARYPDEPAVQLACGDFLAETADQPAAAFPYWQRAQVLAPGDADTAARLANEFLRRGEWRLAAGQFRRALAARPGEASFHFGLANVLTLFRRELTDPAHRTAEDVLRASLEEFHQAARLAPENAEYAHAYAETFYVLAQPDWEAALDAWRAVLALSANTRPDFARSHLARVSLRQNRPAAARAYVGEMHDPAFAGIREKLLRQAAGLERGLPVKAPSDPPARR